MYERHNFSQFSLRMQWNNNTHLHTWLILTHPVELEKLGMRKAVFENAKQ